eukprot:8893249-Heterocapsa_arctica.AAC.1
MDAGAVRGRCQPLASVLRRDHSYVDPSGGVTIRQSLGGSRLFPLARGVAERRRRGRERILVCLLFARIGGCALDATGDAASLAAVGDVLTVDVITASPLEFALVDGGAVIPAPS